MTPSFPNMSQEVNKAIRHGLNPGFAWWVLMTRYYTMGWSEDGASDKGMVLGSDQSLRGPLTDVSRRLRGYTLSIWLRSGSADAS